MVEFLLLGMFGRGNWCIGEEVFETGGFVLKFWSVPSVYAVQVVHCEGVLLSG
jgi:hypothetical protein